MTPREYWGLAVTGATGELTLGDLTHITFYNGNKGETSMSWTGRVVEIVKDPPSTPMLYPANFTWRFKLEDVPGYPVPCVLWAEEDWDCIYINEPAATVSTKSYPHVCPRCGKPAYVGFAKVDCSGGCS